MVYKLPLMAGCGVIPMGNGCDCACECKELKLTKVQDVANRATYDPATGVLNLPPAIVARRQQVALGIYAPPLVWMQVAGLEQIVVDTTGGMMAPVGQDDRLVIPRNGHFNLQVHAQVEAESDGVLFLRMVVQGARGFSRTVTAPVVAGLIGGADSASPASPRTAGDVVRVEMMTTCPTGAVINTASISAEYIEGT
jgi:hypothetical protein